MTCLDVQSLGSSTQAAKGTARPSDTARVSVMSNISYVTWIIVRLCASGSTQGVISMLDEGKAGVNQADGNGRTGMHFAAARGDIAMMQVRVLLQTPITMV